MRLSRLLLGLVTALAPLTLASAPLHAQAAASGPAAGPRLEELRAGFSASSLTPEVASQELNAAAKGPFGSRANGRVAAIVGGAAFVGGLLIGDDAGTVIAVGGLVVGLLGLWTWLG